MASAGLFAAAAVLAAVASLAAHVALHCPIDPIATPPPPKVWLKGEKSGMAETFVDNLPGAPDSIRLGSDGSFWIALLPASLSLRPPRPDHPFRPLRSSRLPAFKMQVRSPWLDLVYRWTLTKRVVASFPTLLEWSKATAKGAMVAQVSEDGNIVRLLDDSEGKVINFVTSAAEYNGHLFLGSLATN